MTSSNRARNRPDRVPQFVVYWDAAMWGVAMDMRGGDSFGVAARKMTGDVAFYHDYMGKDPPADKTKPPKPTKQPEIPDRGPVRVAKGGKAGKGAYDSDRWQPYPRPRWQDSTRWKGGHSQWHNRPYQQSWRGDYYASSSSWTERPNK